MAAKIDPTIGNGTVSATDDEYTEVLDVTTDPTYVFVSQTFDESAAQADKKWRCYRITAANGTKLWAVDPISSKRTREFSLQASLAATYTY